ERLDLELARHCKRDRRHLLAAFCLFLDGGVVLHGCFHNTLRGAPEFVHAGGDGRQGRGGGIFPDLVPGMGSTHHQILALLAYQGYPAATAGSRFSLRTDNLVPHRWRVVVDRTSVAFEVEAGPACSTSPILA